MSWRSYGKLIQNGVMLSLDSNPYSGKKIFVTGHTGFKGAWLVYILHAMQAEVKGYALEPDNNQKLYHLLDIKSRCKSVFGDIRDVTKLAEEIESFQPDFVFHLAAQPLVKEAYLDPVKTIEVNTFGSVNLMNSLKLVLGKCSVVMVTTDKVYRNNEITSAFSENDPLGGNDPYSASKASADILIQSFRSSYYTTTSYSKHLKSIAIVRSGNVIGGGDWSANRIIPDFLRSIEVGQPIALRNPDAVRPWIHVLDNLYGYLLLGLKMDQDPKQFSSEFNFGPQLNGCLSVIEICNQMINILGKGSVKLDNKVTEEKEHQLLRLNSNKTTSMLGWKPQLKTVEAIKWSMDWYKTPKNKAIEITQQQIESYFNSIDL